MKFLCGSFKRGNKRAPQKSQTERLLEGKMQKQPVKNAAARKLFIFGIIAIVAVLLFLGAIVGNGKSKSGLNPESPSAIYAGITSDGTAYIPLMDGTAIEINDKVDTAAITDDRNHVIVLLEDGTLYVTDPKLTEKHVISDKAEWFSYVHNDGFFYEDVDNNKHRVLYEKYAVLNLGEVRTFGTAKNNTTALFKTVDEEIYVLPNTSETKEKIRIAATTVSMPAISDNGEIAVWFEGDGDNQTIMMYDGEDCAALSDAASHSIRYADFTAEQDLMVVGTLWGEEIWIKAGDELPVKVELGAKLNEIDSRYLYTNDGYFDYAEADKVNFLYAAVLGDDGNNVQCISLDGNRERVLSKVNEYEIADGHIVYTDMEDVLYCARVNGDIVREETKIANDVDGFRVSNTGKYVYYMRNIEGESGALYCYKIGSDKPQKIASEVCGADFSPMMHIDVATDGKTVYFFEDVEQIDGTYRECGTLKKWSYNDKNSERIASEVILDSVTSYLDGNEINPKGFAFVKYGFVDGEDNVLGNWMYFDGKEVIKMATDVVC